MRAAMAIALKDLRLRLRDRSLFIYGFIAPFVLALVFSLLLSPLQEGGFTPEVGYVNEDGGPLGAVLGTVLAGLHGEGVLELATGLDREQAVAALEEGEIGAVIVAPPGLTRSLSEGGELEVLGRSGAGLTSQIAQGIADTFMSRLRLTALGLRTLEEETGQGQSLLLTLQSAALPEPIGLVPVETSARQLDPSTYYSAGMAVFFVFFIVQVGVAGLLDEEREGTMSRLLAAPIARNSIVAGKILGSIVLGVLSLTVLAVASNVVLGARWGDALGVAVLILAAVLAAASVLALVAGFSRTPEGAGNLQSIVAVTLAALGGTFFQLPAGEGFLSWLTAITPHHWFLRGIADLSAGGGVASLGQEVTAILLFALVTGVPGWILLTRRLQR